MVSNHGADRPEGYDLDSFTMHAVSETKSKWKIPLHAQTLAQGSRPGVLLRMPDHAANHAGTGFAPNTSEPFWF